MKLFKIIAALVLLTGLGFGQTAAARYDNFTWSTTNIQGTAVLAAIPGASVAVCNFPATGLPCSNLATLYTDSTLATACTGSNGCSNPIVSDTAGNFGFWAASGHYQYTISSGGFNYGPYDITAAPYSATSQSYVNAATRASVIAFGAKGDGVTDDTTAFQNAINGSRSVFIPNNPTPGACYVINGLTFTQSTTIELESRNTCLTVKTAATPDIFYVSGASIASPVAQVNIIGNGGILYAGRTMNSGTAGIKISYGQHIAVSNLLVAGFYDNIFVDNTFYLDLDRVQSNGSTNSALWHQHSDVSHGPYFGGPLTIRGGTFDSGTGPWGLHITDIAVVDIDSADVVGFPNGVGAYFNTTNGIPASPSDYSAGIHVTNSTFDSSASEEVQVINYIKSSFANNWFSGGRTNAKNCVSTDGVQDISFTGNTFFNCGQDGLGLGGTTLPSVQVMVTGNSASGSPGDGIHVVNAQFTTVVGNTCTSTAYSGNGTTQPFCVYEEPTSASNTYVGNDGSNTTFGNAFLGTGATYVDAQAGVQTLSITAKNTTNTGTASANNLILFNDPPTVAAGAYAIGGNTYTCPTAITGSPTGCVMANSGGTVVYMPFWSNAGGGGTSGNPSWWPTIPGTATVFANLQNAAGNPNTWQLATRAQSGSNSCNGTSSSSLTFNVASPVMKTGAALQLTNTTAGSSGGCNQLVYRHLGVIAAGNSTITNMTSDFYAYVIPGSGPGFEWDPDLGDGTGTSSHAYKASFACYTSGGGKWNVYDSQNHNWVATTYSCNWNGAGANTLHHFQAWITFNQTSHTYTYQGLAIDGADVWTPSSHAGLTATTYNACGSGCSGNGSLGANINVEFQSDNDNTNSTSKSLIDKASLTVW